MNILSDLYYKSLAKNDEQQQFWQNYLQNLRSLDFSVYGDKLKVPALVPIGKKILFRGELKHTNEITIALGADYFVKCSISQAEVIRQHRIKGAEAKVEELQKEREYIQNQLSFSAENVFNDLGQEIFEEFSEEEDLKWRKKHRENMREYKQRSKAVDSNQPKEEITDEELWYRLEELELKEELEQEMENMDVGPKKIIKNMCSKTSDTNPVPEKSYKRKKEDCDKPFPQQDNRYVVEENNKRTSTKLSDNSGALKHKASTKKNVVPENDPGLNLLQQVKEKQNEVNEKLADMKSKGISPSQTVKDLLARLDEMDKLEELEEEMDRLDIGSQDEDAEDSEEEESDEESQKTPAVKIKRSVSFADEDNSETLEITFSHSKVEPDTTPYDKVKGITKPSDIYTAFSNLFCETTSILKKSKYERDYTPSGPRMEKRTKVNDFQEAEDNRQLNKTIVINDVVEKVDENDNKYDGNGKRPMSLFKKRRQQNLR